MKSTSSDIAQSGRASNGVRPLPVLTLSNYLIKVLNYLSAVQGAKLPSVISQDPQYATLVAGYSSWQYTVWQQVLLSLVNQGIVAEVAELNKLAQLNITDQSAYQSVVGSGPPTVIGLCDATANQIVSGAPYLNQLLAIAEKIQGADKAKVAELQKIVNKLNAQFESDEDKLTDSALGEGKIAVVTVIDVGVAVATKKDPIAPLVKGVTQIGTSLITQLQLSVAIQATVAQLIEAWNAMNPATQELMAVTMLVGRLKLVVQSSSPTILALDDIVSQWQEICAVISGSPASWASAGQAAVASWAARMSQVSFSGAIGQTISQ